MTDYLQLLEHSYAQSPTNPGDNHSRLEWLADYIFGFTTDEEEYSILFAARALQVCDAVTQGKTFEFIQEDEKRAWYLLMVNMPFFAGRLDYGTSVRGAWWSYEDQELHTCGLWVGDGQKTEWKFTHEEWGQFVLALIVFGLKDLP